MARRRRIEHQRNETELLRLKVQQADETHSGPAGGYLKPWAPPVIRTKPKKTNASMRR